MIEKHLMKTKNHFLWIAVLVAVFISACSSANEVTTPDNVDNPDTTPITLKIFTASTLGKGTPGKIIFFFSEEVTGFTSSVIELSGVNVDEGKFITNDYLRTYIWEITPKETDTLKLVVPANSLTDLSGNKNTASFSNNFTIEEEITPDTTPPTLTISTNSILKENTPGVLTFTFDENVNNFTRDDIELSGIDIKEEGEFITNRLGEYELEVTPKKIGTLNVKVKDNSAHDFAGNPLATFSTKLSVLPLEGKYSLEDVVDMGKIPSDRSKFYELTKDVLSYYSGTPTVVARYVKTDGTGDGSSWAKATNNVKATINGITNANNSKIYLVLVASGNYPSDQIAMKNNVAIIGGWSPSTQWDRIGVTQFDGQGKKRVFFNNNLNRTALLYGATITNGNFINYGGGMYNAKSSPSLVKVTFSENKVDLHGGGMYNNNSFPSLVKVTFSGNEASHGGGIYNWNSSSPTLVKVTFSENRATTSGGGMYNKGNSSPKLVNVTFSGNTATTSGGGMHIANISGDGPLLVNAILWGNQANGNTNQITLESSGRLGLHYSIIQGGTNGLGGTLTSSHTTEGDPLLSSLADNGGFIQTHALGGGSPAINKGVYVKRKGTTFYFSQDNTTWYTGFNNNGLKTTATPPNYAEDLTATDARGYSRVDRPDIGAYENGGTAPTAN